METPTLSRMGIDNPGEIVRYEAYSKGPRKDVLKVIYERKAGSLLPVRRVYEFGRATRTSVSDSGAPRFEDTFEVSPEYLDAIVELDALLAREASGPGRIAHALEQLEALQERIVAGDTPDDLAARFETLRAEIARLSPAPGR